MKDKIVETTLENTATFVLILFTYVIPLLSSIRTIHNRDRESYPQWLAYWLLVHIFSPLFNLLKFYKIFHLSLVLWLSLPRFQGATFIYHEVVDTFLKKYGVEAKLDDKIDTVKKSVKDAMWNIAKDVGWGFLYQIGGVVSFVQDSAASFVEENTISKKSQLNYDYDCSSDDDIDDDVDDDGINDDIENEYNGEDVVVPTRRSLSIKQPSFSSSIGSQPSHSVHESFSSLTTLPSSIESDLASRERQAYVADFLDMLEKGLYVFAWHNDSSIVYQQFNSEGNESNSNDGGSETEAEAKKFRLQIFTFHRGTEGEEEENTNGDVNDLSFFVFNSVESRPEEEKVDAISFPVLLTTRVQESGTNGIQFLTSTQSTDSNNTSPPTMAMNQSVSEPSLTKASIAGSSTSSLLSTVSEGDKNSYETSTTRDWMNEEIIAEIVLSDDKDRNILLAGLNIFLSRNIQ